MFVINELLLIYLYVLVYCYSMNSVSSFLGPQNKPSVRFVAGLCWFIVSVILQGLCLAAVVLIAGQLIHLGVDVALVINAGLVACLVLFYLVVVKLPEQKFLSKKYIAPPLIALVTILFGTSVSYVSAPPFIPPRHTSFAH